MPEIGFPLSICPLPYSDDDRFRHRRPTIIVVVIKHHVVPTFIVAPAKRKRWRLHRPPPVGFKPRLSEAMWIWESSALASELSRRSSAWQLWKGFPLHIDSKSSGAPACIYEARTSNIVVRKDCIMSGHRIQIVLPMMAVCFCVILCFHPLKDSVGSTKKMYMTKMMISLKHAMCSHRRGAKNKSVGGNQCRKLQRNRWQQRRRSDNAT